MSEFKLELSKIMGAFGDDEEIFKVVSHEMIAQIPVSIETLNEAVKANDNEKLRITAHTIKGHMATYGFEEGRDLALEIEKACKDGSFEKAKEKVTNLIDDIKVLEKEIKANL